MPLLPCLSHKESSTCRECQIPCDWTTREFRAKHLCPECYDNLAPLKLIKKERRHAAERINRQPR